MRWVEGDWAGAAGYVGSDACHEQDMDVWQELHEDTFPTLLPSGYCALLPQGWERPLCFKGTIPKILPRSSFFPKVCDIQTSSRTNLNSFLNLLSWETRNLPVCPNLIGFSQFLEKKKNLVPLLSTYGITMSASSPWHSETQSLRMESSVFPQTLNLISGYSNIHSISDLQPLTNSRLLWCCRSSLHPRNGT